MSSKRHLVNIGLLLCLVACAHNSGHAPSKGAIEMVGAKGTIEYKPTDWVEGSNSWWKDSDGIAPGIAGCHIGVDSTGKANGRKFGEACLESGLLVESNPGKDELHSHAKEGCTLRETNFLSPAS